MRAFLQKFLTTLVMSFTAGVGLVSLTTYFGYVTTFWLVCGMPLGFFILWELRSAPAKLKSFMAQLRCWHFLWFLVFLSGLVFRVRDLGTIQANVLDFWALYRIILMGIVAVVLLHQLFFRRTCWDESLFKGLIGLMTGYTVFSLISTVWSVYPMWTLYKSIEYLLDLALIAAIVVSVRTVEEFKTLFDWNWVLTGVLITIVWIEAALWPDFAIIQSPRSLIGVQIEGVFPAMDNNTVGEYGALLAIVALTRLLFATDHRRFYLVAFLVSVVTLVVSQSRSPLTGFLVALILILFTARRIGIVTFFAVLIPVVVSLSPLGDLFWEFFLRGQTAREFESVSGRVALWELSWNLLKEQPLVGYGAYAAGRFAVIGNLRDVGWSSIANTWLEVLLGTGLLGLLPLLGAFLGTWMILLRSVPGAGSYSPMHCLQVQAIGVLAVMSVRSFFTSEFIWHPPLNFFLVLGYAELLRQAYRGQVYEASYNSRTMSHGVVKVQL